MVQGGCKSTSRLAESNCMNKPRCSAEKQRPYRPANKQKTNCKGQQHRCQSEMHASFQRSNAGGELETMLGEGAGGPKHLLMSILKPRAFWGELQPPLTLRKRLNQTTLRFTTKTSGSSTC
mmetsp:Transcript_8034/g.17380  ORF Transcript_8034/g.17380 Transcript_8034/m.17380 type:complete len:121 (-) Transcript_8034:43-405(-)